MSEENTQPSPRADLDVVKLAGGALAAVSSAFLLSTLGAAGTLMGAALGSVIATVAGAYYTSGLERSRQRVREASVPIPGARPASSPGPAGPSAASSRTSSAPDPVAHAERIPPEVVDLYGDAAPADDGGDADGGRGRARRRPSWRVLAATAGVIFVITVGVILAFEGVAGRSVSSITGGTSGDSRTTFSSWGGGSNGSGGSGDRQQPAGEAPSSEGSEQPDDDPSSQPDGEPAPSQSPTPSAEPSAEPSQSPSPTTTPEPTAPPEAPAPAPSPSAPAG